MAKNTSRLAQAGQRWSGLAIPVRIQAKPELKSKSMRQRPDNNAKNLAKNRAKNRVNNRATSKATTGHAWAPRLLDNPPPQSDQLKQMRRERYYQCDGQWYFRTREGFDIGPYDSRSIAEAEAEQLAALHHRAERRLVSA